MRLKAAHPKKTASSRKTLLTKTGDMSGVNFMKKKDTHT